MPPRGEIPESARAAVEAYFARNWMPSEKRVVEIIDGVAAKRYAGRPAWSYAHRAARELSSYRRLKAAGVAVPEPLAAAYDDRAAVLFTSAVEGAVTLRERVEAGEWRDWAGLGRHVRSIHDAGFEHRDLHIGNLLVGSGGLRVVDLHEGRWFDGGLPDWRRARELGFLFMSLQTFATTTDLRRLAQAYGPEWPGRGMFTAALEEMAQARYRYARDRVRRLQPIRVQGIGHEVTGEVIKVAGRRRLERAGASAVKVYERSPLRAVWELITGTGAGRREWRNYEGMRVRHVPTPEARVVHSRFSYEKVVVEWLEGAEPLWEYVRARYAGWAKRDRDAFIATLAATVRRMHDMGAAHGDLKANNVLVRDGKVYFIDLDRVKFAPVIESQRRERNLAELCAAVGAPVTRADRLRFLKAYAGRRTWWNLEWRAIARRVYAATAKRRHRWPAPG